MKSILLQAMKRILSDCGAIVKRHTDRVEFMLDHSASMKRLTSVKRVGLLRITRFVPMKVCATSTCCQEWSTLDATAKVRDLKGGIVSFPQERHRWKRLSTLTEEATRIQQ